MDKVEPPSHILTNHTLPTDPMSDDPLSESLFLVMSNATSESGRTRYLVCAYNAHTGLSYIGISGVSNS